MSNYRVVLALTFFLIPSAVLANEPQLFRLELKEHIFTPTELDLPAGQKIKLVIRNDDSTPAEFESADLNREKVIPAQSEISIYLDPLDAGTYGFYDDFRRDTVKGTIIVK